MKSRAARDAINSVIQDKLQHGLKPGKCTPCVYGNNILYDLSEIIDKPLTLEEQLYLNERKKVLAIKQKALPLQQKDKMETPKLRNRIKENRGRLNLTQLELAKLAGISRVTLGTIERGSRKTDLITAMKIAIAFEVSVPDLFYFETLN